MSAPEALPDAVWASTAGARAAPAEGGDDGLDPVLAPPPHPAEAPVSPSRDGLVRRESGEGEAEPGATPVALPPDRIHSPPGAARRPAVAQAVARLAASLAVL